MDQQKSLIKSRNAIMKFLPRATSSVTFQSPPIYSPAKDKRSSEKTGGHKSNLGIGFSGPLVSMVPADTRRKIKNNNNKNSDYANIVYEPCTSPRVSCMGQIKSKYQKDKLQRAKNNHLPRTHNYVDDDDHDLEETPKTDTNKSKKKLAGFKKIFSGVITPRISGRKKKDMGNELMNSKAPLYLDDEAPNLSRMKRFSSGRHGKFSSIDWTKEIARSMADEDDEHVIVMPSSAPVVIRNSLGFDDKFIRVAGINKEPKKEINLWKRRTLPQPKPLQVNNGI